MRWRRRFLRAHLHGWHNLVARSKLVRATSKTRKVEQKSEQKGKRLAAEAEVEAKLRKAETKRAKEAFKKQGLA